MVDKKNNFYMWDMIVVLHCMASGLHCLIGARYPSLFDVRTPKPCSLLSLRRLLQLDHLVRFLGAED